MTEVPETVRGVEMEDAAMRERLCRALPITEGGTRLRPCTLSDMEVLASWPPYSWPYEAFNFSFRALDREGREAYFVERIERQDRITLVADVEPHVAIGYIAVLRIDWRARSAGNMAMRVHPDRCGQGIGTRTLNMACQWWFENGMQALQLDVAASNQRAVSCYTKAGFTRTGAFWRGAPDLQGVDLSAPKYDFLARHVRCDGPVPEIRFFWMGRER